MILQIFWQVQGDAHFEFVNLLKSHWSQFKFNIFFLTEVFILTKSACGTFLNIPEYMPDLVLKKCPL